MIHKILGNNFLNWKLTKFIIKRKNFGEHS